MLNNTKSFIGHAMGAAGALELAGNLPAFQDRVCHATINLDHPDPECDLDYVPHQARALNINVVVNNSFGFGGHNATLVISRFE